MRWVLGREDGEEGVWAVCGVFGYMTGKNDMGLFSISLVQSCGVGVLRLCLQL